MRHSLTRIAGIGKNMLIWQTHHHDIIILWFRPTHHHDITRWWFRQMHHDIIILWFWQTHHHDTISLWFRQTPWAMARPMASPSWDFDRRIIMRVLPTYHDVERRASTLFRTAGTHALSHGWHARSLARLARTLFSTDWAGWQPHCGCLSDAGATKRLVCLFVAQIDYSAPTFSPPSIPP